MTKRPSLHRLTVYLFVCVLLALGAAALFFVAVRGVAAQRITAYVDSPAYRERQQQQLISSLQSFVDQHQLALREVGQLAAWERQNADSAVTVYAGNRLIYASGMMPEELTDQPMLVGEEDLVGTRSLRFADGTAAVWAWQLSELRLLTLADWGVGLVSFALFVVLLVVPISRKLRYVRQLRQELAILQGGGMEHPITLRGQDELYDLALGIEAMRQSVNRQQQQREAAQQANADLVAAMSHDLRTPLTSLIVYLDMLSEGRARDEKERGHFLESARKKAYQLKEMSDTLFDYAYVYALRDEAPLELTDADLLLGQMLEEKGTELGDLHYPVTTCLEPLQGRLMVNPPLLLRAFDNLLSNIRKHGDPRQEVWISCLREKDRAVIRMENGILPYGPMQDNSTGIGLKTCERVFRCHGGGFASDIREGRFEAHMLLPLQPGGGGAPPSAEH